MAVEIERKFLVIGSEWRPSSPGVAIRQGYLCFDPERSVRVRLAQDQAFLTVKGASEGARRLEFEYPIPCDDACRLLAMCRTGLIEKTRYKIDYSGRIWDVDEFYGPNQGLVMAEIELESETSEVDLPPWAGQEVTGDPRYFNLYLIRHPYTTW